MCGHEMGKKLSVIVKDVHTKNYWYRSCRPTSTTDMNNSRRRPKVPNRPKYRLADPL